MKVSVSAAVPEAMRLLVTMELTVSEAEYIAGIKGHQHNTFSDAFALALRDAIEKAKSTYTAVAETKTS